MTSVLLVEDSATIRHVLTEALHKRGLTVRAIDDGAAVLEAARQLRPAVIILNKMLPRRDGPSLVGELRASSDLAGVGIMMLTEASTREDVVDSIQRGVDAYVIKPFDPADVARRVAELAAPARC